MLQFVGNMLSNLLFDACSEWSHEKLHLNVVARISSFANLAHEFYELYFEPGESQTVCVACNLTELPED